MLKEKKYESSYTPIWFQGEQSPEANYLHLEPNTKHSDLFDVRNKYGRLRKGIYRLVVPVRVSGEYFDVFYEFSY